jgi:FkbM family methyltransferase
MARHIWAGGYDLPGFVPSRGERVLDLGANVGLFSLLAADRGASVTALEPHPETFAWLERNTSGFGVECRNAAVMGRAPSSGAVELVDGPTSTAHHVAGLRDDDPGRSRTTVPAVGFAALVRERYDLIKLDVEGAEFDVVADTPLEVLARIRRLVGEVHRLAGDPEKLRSRLEQAGLVVTLIEGEDLHHSLITARGADEGLLGHRHDQ